MKVCAKREDEPYYRVASDDLQTCEGMAYDEKIARLFAAAPEMFEALQGIQDYAQEMINDIGADIQEGAVFNEHLQIRLTLWNNVIHAFLKAKRI